MSKALSQAVASIIYDVLVLIFPQDYARGLVGKAVREDMGSLDFGGLYLLLNNRIPQLGFRTGFVLVQSRCSVEFNHHLSPARKMRNVPIAPMVSTWGSLDGTVVEFLNESRPHARYVYLNYAACISPPGSLSTPSMHKNDL